MTGGAPIMDIAYEGNVSPVNWRGVCLSEGQNFDLFLADDVIPRLHDVEGAEVFKKHLRGLASTGFAHESLDQILAAANLEERAWAIGESIAEAYLSRYHNVIWPWNHEKDKRNPKASLPGADLIGFEVIGQQVRLVLGEVKTSYDAETPPSVMTGRSGMIHQIDNLANDLGCVYTLLYWLFSRCKGTEYELTLNAALAIYIESGNKNVALYGILIRDTTPNQLDLINRGKALAKVIKSPTSCQLIAVYLPCPIVDLPNQIREGGRL